MADNWYINWVIQAPSPHQDHSTNAISAGGGGKCKVGDGNSNTKWKWKHKNFSALSVTLGLLQVN